MTSPISNVTPLWRAIQYTGSNGNDVDAAISPFIDFVIVSETGGVLSFTTNSSPYTADTGNWLVYSVSSIGVLGNSQLPNEWNCVSVCSDLDALSTSVSGAFVRSIGVAPVPTLLLSGSANVSVQLQPAMPDSNYTAYASKFAGVSLTDLQINSVTVVDADTVTVAVQNVGLGTIIGASIMVHAIE